jgi:hypothetical protein
VYRDRMLEGTVDADTLTLERFAREHAPQHVSVDADPTSRRPFAAYNVVGSFSDKTAARRVLRVEQDKGVNAYAQSVVIVGGSAPPSGVDDAASDAPPPVGPDPERVAGDTARRIVPGAVVGGLIVAVVVALGTALLTDISPPAIFAAAVGAGAAGAAIGGIVGAFWGFGNSEAFRHTFTDLQAGVTLVAMHTDDAREARRVEQEFTDAGADRVWLLDPHGKPVSDV